MTQPSLDSILLASTNPQRLAEWYANGLNPQEDTMMDQYRILTFGNVHLLIDPRDDVAEHNPDPARVILNFDVADARAAVDRLDNLGTRWLAELEDRNGSLFATAIDPDGNYVQLIQMSEEQRKAMEAQAAGSS